MPFKATAYSQRISFEIPDQDFMNLLNYETANYREFDLPTLSAMLDMIDGVDSTDYNGHFGAQVFSAFDIDDNGQTPQVDEYQSVLEDFFLDARRIAAIMPEILKFPRHDIHDIMLEREPEQGKGRAFRTFLYSDDDFLIATGEDSETVTIFHREGGELGTVDARMPPSVARVIAIDRDKRSFNPHKRKPITMSKDLKGVRQWVQKHVALDIKVPTVDVEGHPLAGQLPEGSRPVLMHKKFLVADSGREMGLSITFVSEGEPGTKWFLDEARRSILRNIEQGGGSLGGLNAWILRQLPQDVERPGLSSARR